jgi:hypothetical protein
MVCPHVKNLICDYPVTTGDIICTTCPHYPSNIKKVSIAPQLWVSDNPKTMFAITIMCALVSLGGVFVNIITHYILGLIIAIILYVGFMLAVAKFTHDIYIQYQKR